MSLERSIAVADQDGDAVRGVRSAVHNHKVHLAILVPVHGSQINGRGTSGEVNVRAESAIAIVNQNGDSIGAVIDCGEIRNVVSIKVGHNKLGRSGSDGITLRSKTLAKTGERKNQTKCDNDEGLHEATPMGEAACLVGCTNQ